MTKYTKHLYHGDTIIIKRDGEVIPADELVAMFEQRDMLLEAAQAALPILIDHVNFSRNKTEAEIAEKLEAAIAAATGESE